MSVREDEATGRVEQGAVYMFSIWRERALVTEMGVKTHIDSHTRVLSQPNEALGSLTSNH